MFKRAEDPLLAEIRADRDYWRDHCRGVELDYLARIRELESKLIALTDAKAHAILNPRQVTVTPPKPAESKVEDLYEPGKTRQQIEDEFRDN